MEAPRQPPGPGVTWPNRRSTVLWTIIVILLVLWLLGLIGSIGGGFIHLLLVLAIVVFVAQLLTGRRSV
jgi:K+-transporting ATPase A subunit